MGVERTALLYEGKSKRVFETSDPDLVILEFKDDATAFDGVKHALISDKGRINCALSAYLFDRLREAGVDSHMVEKISDTEMVCHRVEIVPIEVVVRNYVAGSLAKRYGLEEGGKLPRPLVEFFYKSDELGDPLMGWDVPVILGWSRDWEMAFMKEQALQVNEILCAFWDELGVDLVDYKLEFGRRPGAALVLADEVTPDGCRLWEKGTRRKLDKDVFRRDLGDLSTTYHEVYQRVFGVELGT
jgi:phosphoribosylaminoimidazole-succinocarboxamide synthase